MRFKRDNVYMLGAVAGGIVIVALLCRMAQISATAEIPELEAVPIETLEQIERIEAKAEPVEIIEVKEAVPTDEEIIARVVMAEAEGEEMIGKVAVAMAVLNQCDYYGLTAETIAYIGVYEIKQFSISDTYNEDCMRAVEIAQANRDLFPSTMMWFQLDDYHDFGNGNPQDYMKIGNHYFSYLRKEEMK